MANGRFEIPYPTNEPVLQYAHGSPEKLAVKAMIKELKSKKLDIPMIIGGEEIRTKNKLEIRPPHEIKHLLGTYSKGTKSHVVAAVKAALAAKDSWEKTPWQERAAIFLKAADLLAGPYRAKMNAATMLCQSKNVYQAEIDCVAELCDFFRFNAQYMTELYDIQPESSPTIWNRLEYRALEGFIFAISPFNFTSIAGNLPGAPALMGNTVVWKPAETQIYSAIVIMEILEEAGLPPGVINLIYVDGPVAGGYIFDHAEFAGLHFTGSTGVFQHLWKTIGNNIDKYNTYPRIVGETGGKDFIVAHASSNADVVSTAIVRGAFEYQGQKCSAASRVYVPESMWPAVEKNIKRDLKAVKMGSPENFTHFINAVISEAAFDKISGYISAAKKDSSCKIVAGGKYDKKKGYFIEPTVILTTDPKYTTLCEEIFGPVVTIYVYKDKEFNAALELVDNTSEYALTGAIFATDRAIVEQAHEVLKHSAGNFYVNDKPTGAVVGQQPFGGARASGTNDKAGSILNLIRWVSPRTIKENFNPPKDFRYPFMLKA